MVRQPRRPTGVDLSLPDHEADDEPNRFLHAWCDDGSSGDVDVLFENGVLTLRGERKLEKEDRRDNYHRIELGYGTFTRSFALPGTVDADKIKAESKNGVLVVTLPKRIEARPRSIQVKVT